jgi:hypothetical protein
MPNDFSAASIKQRWQTSSAVERFHPSSIDSSANISLDAIFRDVIYVAHGKQISR